MKFYVKAAWVTPALLGGLILMTSCPSETTRVSASQIPGDVQAESLLDEVDVMGSEEALDQATSSIDEGNVLEQLDALEEEIDDD